MSSIYLHQTRGEMSQSLKNLSPRSPKRMTAYGRAIFVSIAVPLIAYTMKDCVQKFYSLRRILLIP